MARLEGRVAIVTWEPVTGSVARSLFMGAAVVVNDLGAALDGSGADASAAQLVVAEIEAAGGRAIASSYDVSDWQQASALIELAVQAFGEMHVLGQQRRYPA